MNRVSPKPSADRTPIPPSAKADSPLGRGSMDNFAWCFGGFDWPRQGPSQQEYQPNLKYDSDNAYAFYLKLGALKNANERFFKGKIPFWNDLLTHDTYDAFWQARTPLPHFKNLTPAFLVVGGFFDAEDLWGPQHMIRALEKQSPKTPAYVVLGPWSHGGWGGNGGFGSAGGRGGDGAPGANVGVWCSGVTGFLGGNGTTWSLGSAGLGGTRVNLYGC